MSLYVDKKFVSLVGLKLERFKQKQEYVWNCRCPVCKDSKKNRFKARGYFYKKKGNLVFSCHNCHAFMSLGSLIKTLDPHLYQQYQLEVYAEQPHSNVKRPDFSEFLQMAPRRVIDLPSIDKLPVDHFARQYVASRKIPIHWWKDLYYADDFKAFCESTFTADRIKDKGLYHADKRLVIPSLDENGGLLCVQGRTLSGSEIRYITIKAHEDSTKVFGLHNINFKKLVYVFEGPIDSMFVSNSLATMDSALYRVVETLGRRDYVFCYDNQPRNIHVVHDVKKTIDMGYKVCLLPDTGDSKDINEMVLEGLDVQELIDTHTYQGLQANLEFTQWRKV
jgi:hypothetical protein